MTSFPEKVSIHIFYRNTGICPDARLYDISPESWLMYCIGMNLRYNNKLGVILNNACKHIVFMWFYIIIVNSILSE